MVIVARPQKIRICLDPKDLNRAVQRPKFQMPTFEELLPSSAKHESSVPSTQRMDFIKLALMMRVANSLLSGHPLEEIVT